MRISAANKLVGQVINIKPGTDMAEVYIDIGDQLVTATISTAALGDMHMQQGDKVFAVFNSGDVSIIHDTSD